MPVCASNKTEKYLRRGQKYYRTQANNYYKKHPKLLFSQHVSMKQQPTPLILFLFLTYNGLRKLTTEAKTKLLNCMLPKEFNY